LVSHINAKKLEICVEDRFSNFGSAEAMGWVERGESSSKFYPLHMATLLGTSTTTTFKPLLSSRLGGRVVFYSGGQFRMRQMSHYKIEPGDVEDH